MTNVHYVLVELDGNDAAKDERVRELLKLNGFRPAGIDTKDGCCPTCDCASNELFVHPQFAARKAAREASLGAVRHYHYGTGVRC